MATINGKAGFSDKDAEEAAKSFKKAMKGIGTDEKRIIKEMLAFSNAQRQDIKEKYYNMYGKTLDEDLKSELTGNFDDIVIALLMPRFVYEAECMNKAIKGFGTKEKVIIELLCSKEAAEIEQLKQVYQETYGADLEKEIKNEEDGPLGRIFRSLASADRPSGRNVDGAMAQEEAKQLYDAGEGKNLGTDEVEFVRILCSRSFAQLRATFQEYEKLSSTDIEKSLKKELSGDLEDALLAIVKSIKNRNAYFAERLRESMSGAGTNDSDLIRIIVSRCEIDLGDIRREYSSLYNRDLVNDLKDELKGDYEDIVVALVGRA